MRLRAAIAVVGLALGCGVKAPPRPPEPEPPATTPAAPPPSRPPSP